MSETSSVSGILSGEPCVSSAPPLILLQSEEDCSQPPEETTLPAQEQGVVPPDQPEEKSVASPKSSAFDTPVSEGSRTQVIGPTNVPGSSCFVDGNQESSRLPAHEPWGIENLLSEDKNPFSGLSEEHLSQLEDVLSSEEVRSFLQQTHLHELDSRLVPDSVPLSSGARGVSSSRDNTASEESLKLDLFETPTTSSLQISEALAHQIIQQDSVREHELAVMAAAFTDHAYALPSAGTPSDSSSSVSPRKSARIKQRMDDGKSAFESDGDFEYYLTSSRRGTKKDEHSEGERTDSPAATSPAPNPNMTRVSQPKRRSTRIVDMENREKAEKILQENRQKEQEAKEAMKKKMEEMTAGDDSAEEVAQGRRPKQSQIAPKRKSMPTRGKKGKPALAEIDTSAEPEPAQKAKGKLGKGKRSTRTTRTKGASEEFEGSAVKETDLETSQEEPVGAEGMKDASEKKQNRGKTRVTGKKAKKQTEKQQQNLSSKRESLGVEDQCEKLAVVGKEHMVQATLSKLKQSLGSLKTEVALARSQKKEAPARDSSDEDVPLKALATMQKSSDTGADDGGQPSSSPLDELTAAGKECTSSGASAIAKTDSSPQNKKGQKQFHQKQKSKAAGMKKQKHDIVVIKGKMDDDKSDEQKSESSGDVRDRSAPSKMEEVRKVSSAVKTEESQHGTKTVKHKHRKSEDVVIDPTVTDLFKPDGVIPTESIKREEGEAECQPGPVVKSGQDKMEMVEVKPEAVGTQQLLKTVSKPYSARSATAHGYGDAGPDPGATKEHTVKNTGQQAVGKDIGAKSWVRKTESGGCKVASGQSEQPQQIVYVSLRSEKGHVKIVHSQLESTSHKKSTVSPLDSVVSPIRSASHVAELQISADDAREQKPGAEKTKHISRHKRTFHKRKSAAAGDDEHDSGGDLSYEDDENDSDWEPSNDPDTVYCLCKKPHGNRFMICCDKCQEWYHGQCVGISKAQGRQMEREDKDYICPVCSGTVASPEKIKSEPEEKEKLPADQSSSKRSIDVHYEKKRSEKHVSGREKWLIQRCIVSDCKRDARLGSVYCSNDCIVRHVQESLRLLRSSKERLQGSKPVDVRPSEVDRVTVWERRSGRVLKGTDAPTEAQLALWLETHPSFEVMQPSVSSPSSFYSKKHRRSSSGSVKREERRNSDVSVKAEDMKGARDLASTVSKKDDGPDQVRLNVRKSLRDALANRAEEADDVVLSSGEIKKLALSIEEELFKVFEDTGHKYRAKYRSLIFNIKDQKNKGLFRKILTSKIKPSKLVRMSTEELASRELAKWRQMETKHTLAMIEQTEKEAMKEGQHHIRKKTHKGEVEVDDEDMSTLEARLDEPKTKSEVKEEEVMPAVIVDTTDQHRAHLFDLNCKICTGKILPPATEEPTPKKVKVAHRVVEERRKSHHSKSKSRKRVEIQAEEVVRHALAQVRRDSMEASAASNSPSSESGITTPISSTPTGSTPCESTLRMSTTPSVPAAASASAPSVTVGSLDSALQSGLEAKPKFTLSGPMVWKGFISMQDFAKLFTSAYRVSGPVDHLGLPDTLQICGRIGPDQMWDYLGKIRQAGSRDICILRFIPGSDDEKVAYVHLYSYLNSRGRCGVVGNAPKHIKDLYIVPLASHSKIPQVLLPFDGPGFESNRPHMLIGIVVRQKVKHASEAESSSKPSSSKTAKKLQVSSTPEAYSPTAADDNLDSSEAVYIPTPTATKQSATSASLSSTPSSAEQASHHHHRQHHHHHHRRHHHESGSFQVSGETFGKILPAVQLPSMSDDSQPYSPGKEAELEAPYDPEDDSQFTTVDATVSQAPVGLDILQPAKHQQVAASSAGPAVPASVTSSASLAMDTFVEKIANSSNPQEISSFMLAMLATAKDSVEQQQLLATLTRKVDEKKRKKAEQIKLTAQERFTVSTHLSEVALGSTVELSGETGAEVGEMASAAVCAGGSTTTESATKEMIAVPPVSRISTLTQEAQDMPLALKALMEDLKGNMQMAKAVDRRTERERREWEKKEAAKQAAQGDGQTNSDSPSKDVSVSGMSAVESIPGVSEKIPGLFESSPPHAGGTACEAGTAIEQVAGSQVHEGKCSEVSSSTDSGKMEEMMATQVGDVSSSAVGLEAELALSDVDLRQKPVASEPLPQDQSAGDSSTLSQDQDDRVMPHSVYPPLPMHPSRSVPAAPPVAYPPHYMAPPRLHHRVSRPFAGQLLEHPRDVDRRHHFAPSSQYPHLAAAARPPTQPPPPGTEMEDIVGPRGSEGDSSGDVDFRQQVAKRLGGFMLGADQPHPKVSRMESAPPLPPLPPQSPPPLPPLPSSSSTSVSGEGNAGHVPGALSAQSKREDVDSLGSHRCASPEDDELWPSTYDRDRRQQPPPPYFQHQHQNRSSHLRASHLHSHHQHSPHRRHHGDHSRRHRGDYSHRDRH